MIPVPSSELKYYDISNEADIQYKNLIMIELREINRNQEKIIKNAKILYSQKSKNLSIGYIRSTVDFKALEKAYLEFNS